MFRRFARTCSKSRVSRLGTDETAVLLHEASGNIGGGQFLGFRCGLKKDNSNRILVDVILRKGHKHKLRKELIIKGIGSEFSVLHHEKREVRIHVVAVVILLLEHSHFYKECGYSCVRVCMSSFQGVPNILS